MTWLPVFLSCSKLRLNLKVASNQPMIRESFMTVLNLMKLSIGSIQLSPGILNVFFVWRFRLAIPCNDSRIYRVQVHPWLPEADYGWEKAKGLVSWCHDATNENYVNMLHTSAFRLNLRFPDTPSQAFTPGDRGEQKAWQSSAPWCADLAAFQICKRTFGNLYWLSWLLLAAEPRCPGDTGVTIPILDCIGHKLLRTFGVISLLACPSLSWQKGQRLLLRRMYDSLPH